MPTALGFVWALLAFMAGADFGEQTHKASLRPPRIVPSHVYIMCDEGVTDVSDPSCRAMGQD
jgi:hypothetical protein